MTSRQPPYDSLSDLERALRQMTEAHKLEREAQRADYTSQARELAQQQAQAEFDLKAHIFELQRNVFVLDVAELPDRLRQMISDNPNVPYVILPLSSTARETYTVLPTPLGINRQISTIEKVWLRIARGTPPFLSSCVLIHFVCGDIFSDDPQKMRVIVVWMTPADGIESSINEVTTKVVDILGMWKTDGDMMLRRDYWEKRMGL